VDSGSDAVTVANAGRVHNLCLVAHCGARGAVLIRIRNYTYATQRYSYSGWKLGQWQPRVALERGGCLVVSFAT